MTIIKAVDVGEVTRAILQMLNDHPAIGNSNVAIERSGEPPDDPGPFGWVGIYRSQASFNPRALGYGSGYRDHKIRLCVHVRMSNLDSPEGCEDDIETLIANIVGTILSDETLKGTVDNLAPEFTVQYQKQQIEPDKDEDAYWIQVANIFFEAETTVKEG